MDEIERIKRMEIFGGQYDPDSGLTLDDQLWIRESLTGEVEQKHNNPNDNTNVKWNGNVNVPHKLSINLVLTENKLRSINDLKTLNYKTPPIQIAENLRTIFADQNSKEEHWLFLAQKWHPKSINSVICQILKEQELGWKTIHTPAAYFTFLIRHHPKRKAKKP